MQRWSLMSILYLGVRTLRYDSASCADLKISYVGPLPWNSIFYVCLHDQPFDINMLISHLSQSAWRFWVHHLIFTAYDYHDQQHTIYRQCSDNLGHRCSE